MTKTTKISKTITFKEAAWTAAFMGVTIAAVTMELFSVAKKDPEFPAWTNLAVKYVPRPVAFAAAGYLATWLPAHLVKYYRKAREV